MSKLEMWHLEISASVVEVEVEVEGRDGRAELRVGRGGGGRWLLAGTDGETMGRREGGRQGA